MRGFRSDKHWNNSKCNPYNTGGFSGNSQKYCPGDNLLPLERIQAPHISNVRLVDGTLTPEGPRSKGKLRVYVNETYESVSYYEFFVNDGTEAIKLNKAFPNQYIMPEYFYRDEYYTIHCYAYVLDKNGVLIKESPISNIFGFHGRVYIPSIPITMDCVTSIGGQHGYDFKMDGIWTKNCPMFAEEM